MSDAVAAEPETTTEQTEKTETPEVVTNQDGSPRKRRGRPPGSKKQTANTQAQQSPAKQTRKPATAAVPRNDLVARDRAEIAAEVKVAKARVAALTKELGSAQKNLDRLVASEEALSEESISRWREKLATERDKLPSAA